MAALEESLAAVKSEPLGRGRRKKPAPKKRARQEEGAGEEEPSTAKSKPQVARLRAPKTRTEVEVDGRTLSLSNLDKVLWPKSKTTKGEAIDYYARVADTIVPHLKGRPLTRVRFPDGVDGYRFYEKRAPKGAPGLGQDGAGRLRPGGRDRLRRLRRQADARSGSRRWRRSSSTRRSRRRGAWRCPTVDGLRPRPGPARPRSASAAWSRCGSASSSQGIGLEVVREELGLEGPPGLRAAERHGRSTSGRSRSPRRSRRRSSRPSPTSSSRR